MGWNLELLREAFGLQKSSFFFARMIRALLDKYASHYIYTQKTSKIGFLALRKPRHLTIKNDPIL